MATGKQTSARQITCEIGTLSPICGLACLRKVASPLTLSLAGYLVSGARGRGTNSNTAATADKGKARMLELAWSDDDVTATATSTLRVVISDTERVWELMQKIGICMLASWDGKELQARPTGAYVRPEENAVFFLADRRHHKDDDIKTYSKVCLAFSDTSGQKYVSVSGNAKVLDDRSKIHDLWGVAAKAWWNSPEDANLQLLKITPLDAHATGDGRKSQGDDEIKKG